MSLASDLASILESLGYGTWGGGTTPGATIAVYREPPVVSPTDPTNTLTVYPVGGPPDALDLGGNSHGERPVQLRFRDADPVALETRIESLYALWTAWQTYGAVRLKASSKPLYLYPSEDSAQGSLYIASFNVTCIRGS